MIYALISSHASNKVSLFSTVYMNRAQSSSAFYTAISMRGYHAGVYRLGVTVERHGTTIAALRITGAPIKFVHDRLWLGL